MESPLFLQCAIAARPLSASSCLSCPDIMYICMYFCVSIIRARRSLYAPPFHLLPLRTSLLQLCTVYRSGVLLPTATRLLLLLLSRHVFFFSIELVVLSSLPFPPGSHPVVSLPRFFPSSLFLCFQSSIALRNEWLGTRILPMNPSNCAPVIGSVS